MVYLQSTCSQFHTYSTRRDERSKIVSSVCENHMFCQYYVGIKQLRLRSRQTGGTWQSLGLVQYAAARQFQLTAPSAGSLPRIQTNGWEMSKISTKHIIHSVNDEKKKNSSLTFTNRYITLFDQNNYETYYYTYSLLLKGAQLAGFSIFAHSLRFYVSTSACVLASVLL